MSPSVSISVRPQGHSTRRGYRASLAKKETATAGGAGPPAAGTAAAVGTLAYRRRQLEFEEDLGQARLRDLTGALTRQPRAAPLLTDVLNAAGITNEKEVGLRDIPLAQVKGSDNRSMDFDVSFLPRSRHLRPTWVRLYAEMEGGKPINPIDSHHAHRLAPGT